MPEVSPRAARVRPIMPVLALALSLFAGPTTTAPAAATGPSGPSGPSGTPTFPSIPVIVIDPGHGGPDSGAVNCRLRFAGRRCMEEKDVTLAISRRVATLLRDQGFQVTLTRTTDQAVDHPARNIPTWHTQKGHHLFHVDGKIDVDDELQARTNVADCNHTYGCAH